jgi:glycosyltransferase involved in cell wall biosynthesis
MIDSNTRPCVVSVVIPAYNAEIFILRAVESALNQKVEDCEILIVNDGSTDQTAAKLAIYDNHPQVRLLSHPGGINRGVCASRRLALCEARGGFIAFLDADDEYLPGKLARHIKILRENPQVALVHSSVQRRTEEPETKTPWTLNLGAEAEIYDLTKKSYFLRRNYICNSSVVCRRSALRPEEDLPPNMIGQSEDWVLWNCISFRGLFYYDPAPLTIYSYHAASFTHRLKARSGAAELTAIEFYLSMLPRLPRLGMRVRAFIALIYHLKALTEIRRGPQMKAGFFGRLLQFIFDRVKTKAPHGE